MESSLIKGALALGIVSWCCGIIAARAQNEAENIPIAAPTAAPQIAPAYWFFAIAAPLLFWLLTLPEAPPFGMGHASGNGVLLGGFGALIGALALLKTVHWHSPSSRRAALGMMLSLAASVVILVPLLWKQGRLDALMGAGIGWLAVLFLLSLGCASVCDSGYASPLFSKAAAFGATCCACMGMGIFRDAMLPGVANATWSGLMAIISVAVPFVLLLCALPADLMARKIPFPQLMPRRDVEVGTARGWQVILAAIVLLILTQLLATKVADKPELLFCVASGAVAGFIAWRLCADDEENSLPFLASLVLLAAFIVSYRLMQGFGGGAMILAAWLPALADDEAEIHPLSPAQRAPVSHPSSLIPRPFFNLLAFGAVAMLYRFAATRFRYDLDTLQLDEYFSFFALMLGAALPPFLARLQAHKGEQSPVESGLRALMCGAFLLAVPAVGVMLWGAQTALVLTAGAAIGLLLLSAQNLRIAPAFFALGGALALAQWTKHALPLYEITRADKTKYLGALTVALAVLLLMVDLISRRKTRAV